jgi:large subunit ribosomal protein L9
VLDIAEALKERGIAVERRRIGLREHIKEVGDYDVVVKLHRDVSPSIKVIVRKEGAADEPKAVEAAPAADSVPTEPVDADLTTTPLETPESEAEAATADE